ncbi:hypothetical protein CUMW_195490 [Citrus unshiu]|uniref:Uncharacterized protein n=1 Tax=Citrus unshiu TaxID=55188 RepID=A0A2H5Q4K1_CITUN|nr:hypothetical protein CUMW_195490 [Citrus unshiu]
MTAIDCVYTGILEQARSSKGGTDSIHRADAPTMLSGDGRAGSAIRSMGRMDGPGVQLFREGQFGHFQRRGPCLVEPVWPR